MAVERVILMMNIDTTMIGRHSTSANANSLPELTNLTVMTRLSRTPNTPHIRAP